MYLWIFLSLFIIHKSQTDDDDRRQVDTAALLSAGNADTESGPLFCREVMARRLDRPDPDPLRTWIQTASRGDLLTELGTWNTAAQLEALRVRFSVDGAWWAAHCFPHLVFAPYNRVHRWLFSQVWSLPGWAGRVSAGMTETCRAIEAPRGIAKTTLLKLFVLWSLTYGREPYIVWVSGNQNDAKKETRHIRAELEHPSDAYLTLYGQPRTWGEIFDWRCEVGPHEAMVSTRGIPRGRVRGINNNGQRPTCFVGDDIEHPDSVRNARMRDDLTEYINSDVRNAGPTPQGGLLWIQSGTRLGADSQTARAAADPAYVSAHFSAVITWPERMDLWERCRKLWADKTNPERKEDAQTFYDLHREEMDRGAEVIAPQTQPLYHLMVLLWSKGRASFFKDYQNDPRASGSTTFDLDAVKRLQFDGEVITWSNGRTVALKDCAQVIWFDPRASKDAKRNDFAAIALVVRDPAGYRGVLEVSLRRDAPSAQRARLWSIAERYPSAAVYYEDNGFQSMFGDSFTAEREAREAAGEYADMRPIGITSRENKDDVIASIEPDIWHGWLQFAEGLPAVFWQQMRDHPGGDHDDGPEAVAKADRQIRRGNWAVG
jgi:hypothetical protein